jgi:hypothetical protein
MAGVAGNRIQQVRKDPFVDLTTSACRQANKTDTALPRGPGPANLTGGFDAYAGKPQIKVQLDALSRKQRRNCLHSYTFMVEIADDSAVSFIEGYVG